MGLSVKSMIPRLHEYLAFSTTVMEKLRIRLLHIVEFFEAFDHQILEYLVLLLFKLKVWLMLRGSDYIYILLI